MTKKIFIHIAALSVIATCALGCDAATNDSNDKTDSDILAAPVVELPPSAGTNPFVGKTFSGKRYYDGTTYYYVKYLFKDEKTILYYEKNNNDEKDFELEAQYKYSVNANTNVLSWHIEKRQIYGNEFLSYSEEIEYLNAAYNNEAFNNIAPNIKKIYTDVYRYEYKYDETNKTLDFTQIFDEDIVDFHGSEDDNKYYGKYHVYNLWIANYYIPSMHLQLYDGEKSLNFQGDLNKSAKTFALVRYDNGIEVESDKITGTYKFIGSGNSTKMELSFTYNEQLFNPTLNFDSDKMQLTEE